VRSTERRRSATLPDADTALSAIDGAAAARDLVGIYAVGASHAGFANSLGQRNWYTAPSFNLDWSFFHDADKAVKASYAGTSWNAVELERKVAAAAEQLAVLAQPARTLRPGRYRVYLAPSALYEILGVLSWGGFGLRAHRTRTTPLIKMIRKARTLPGVCATRTPPGLMISGCRLHPSRSGDIDRCRAYAISGLPRSAASMASNQRSRRQPDRRRRSKWRRAHRVGDVLRSAPAVRQRPVVSELLRPHRLSHHRHDPLGREQRDQSPTE
jgi:hypothetical protein